MYRLAEASPRQRRRILERCSIETSAVTANVAKGSQKLAALITVSFSFEILSLKTSIAAKRKTRLRPQCKVSSSKQRVSYLRTFDFHAC